MEDKLKEEWEKIKADKPKTIIQKLREGNGILPKKNSFEETRLEMTGVIEPVTDMIKRIIEEERHGVPVEEDETLEEIDLPGLDKLISDFAERVVNKIKGKNTIFFRQDSKDIVEIGKVRLKDDEDEIYTGFMTVKPNRFITMAEKYFIPGVTLWSDYKKTHEFHAKSMTKELANTLLVSEIFQNNLPQINRIFTIPVPIIYNGKLTFPKRGYDRRFYSWLPVNAPSISNENMSIEEAKKVLLSLFKEFCFQTRQDYNNAIAAILTPYLRGLFRSFSTRTPVFFYLANRERAGKDYLAGITGIVYEGHALEDSPVSNSENEKSNNTEELRKKILAALIGGRKRMHFSNNKGTIDNAVFESIITAEKYSDRVLGRSESLTFENELDFSLSGNTGIGFTPDFANRCRFIRLFLDLEDANAREFENPDLHGWVLNNREIIISALFALVRNWIEKGKPEGSIPFASFPGWAKICGGIMESAGYDNPCTPDREVIALGGDAETTEMKAIFEECFERCPNRWIKKDDIKTIALEKNVAGSFDFTKKADQTRFGNLIIKFTGRVLSDIRLIVKDKKMRAARQEFMFTKEQVETNKDCIFELDEHGNQYNLGNFTTPKKILEEHFILRGGDVA